VRSGAVERPYHLAMLIGEIEAYARAKGGPVALLDHGCGGGMTLMFLAALGYTDVFGVDVGGDRTPQNRWARVALGYEDDRFVIYDGSRLPLADASIDIVFSQQVLEHVAPKVFASYYEEEARVLKEGGLAIHQVPHRLVPYESHLRLWGWHMLPPMLRDPVLKKRGIEWPSHLHLRWPSAHKRMAAAIIGPTADLTATRLLSTMSLDYYDGPIGLRRLAARIFALPLVGGLAARVAASFVMLETRSVRQRA